MMRPPTKPLLFFAAILIIDRITKGLVLRYPEGAGVEIWPGFFNITVVHNTGAAFGLLSGRTDFLVLITIFFLVASGVYFLRLSGHRSASSDREPVPVFAQIAWALIFAGAAGNLTDRLWYGYVIDFLDFRILPKMVTGPQFRIEWHGWPVFNIADAGICAGAFLVGFQWLVLKKRPHASDPF